MRLPGIRIRMLMAVVAIVAIDFAAVRALYICEPILFIISTTLINTVPIGIALHIGLFRMFYTHGRSRAFWVGFLFVGAVALTTSAWAALTPPGWGPSGTGKIRHESSMWVLWNSYFGLMTTFLKTCHFDPSSLAPASGPPGIGFITLLGLIAFMPQLAAALVSGLVARSIAGGPDGGWQGLRRNPGGVGRA